METSTITSTPTINPLHKITSPFDKDMDSPEFFKMEDFDNDSTPNMDVTSTSQSNATPPPVVVQSKPAKKRKSWGQQLPEPKTTLPPRKRAKTDDEKEQRRIERIKRNRAAAHNSRERKRQEAEVLAVENAQLRTKLEAFEKHFGPLPSHIVLPEVTLSTDDADTPAPSLIESHGSMATAPSPASPPDLYDATTNTSIKQEPHDSPLMPDTYPTFDLGGKDNHAFPTLALLDETQHSAEMLSSSLPCQSRSKRVAMATPPPTTRPNSFPPSPTTTAFLTLLTTLNLTFLTTYKALLQAMWTPSPSRRAPRTSSSAARASTSPSTTSSPRTSSRAQPLPSSATALAQRNAATAVPCTGSEQPATGVRRPLVGEGSELRTRSGVGASGGGAAGRGGCEDVMRAFDDDGTDGKSGVGRDGSLDR